MFCPQCGERQISEEMRFCSRCGLELGAVNRLLSGAELVESPAEVQALRGVRRGIYYVLAAFATLIVLLPLAALTEIPIFLVVPPLLLIIGFVRLLHSAFVKAGPLSAKTDAQPPLQMSMPQSGAHLPPAATTPIGDPTARRFETAEFATPPSVTERTTKLLDEDPT